MSLPIPIPVGVLRLPRGPAGVERGFDPTSPRAQALLGATTTPPDLTTTPPGLTTPPRPTPTPTTLLQGARARLRRRYLQGVSSALGRPVRLSLLSGVQVEGVFAAADVINALAIQVDSLQTPLGVEAAALLRCSDVLAYSFLLH